MPLVGLFGDARGPAGGAEQPSRPARRSIAVPPARCAAFIGALLPMRLSSQGATSRQRPISTQPRVARVALAERLAGPAPLASTAPSAPGPALSRTHIRGMPTSRGASSQQIPGPM